MIFNPALRRILWFSLFCHLGALFIFSFSFSPARQVLSPDIYFMQGGLFSDTASPAVCAAGIKHFFAERKAVLFLERARHEPVNEAGGVYSKPQSEPPFSFARAEYKEPPDSFNPGLKKTGPAIIFHPQIPYSLAPYFKDREAVHIELFFNIVQLKETSSVQIKRKISSGNLEADLLSMRYINRYLSMQKQEIPGGNWQTVKIDLSLK